MDFSQEPGSWAGAVPLRSLDWQLAAVTRIAVSADPPRTRGSGGLAVLLVPFPGEFVLGMLIYTSVRAPRHKVCHLYELGASGIHMDGVLNDSPLPQLQPPVSASVRGVAPVTVHEHQCQGV